MLVKINQDIFAWYVDTIDMLIANGIGRRYEGPTGKYSVTA